MKIFLFFLYFILGCILFFSCKKSVDLVNQPNNPVNQPNNPVNQPNNPVNQPTIEDLFGLKQFVEISAGSFQMGSNNGAHDEKPVHTVTLTNSFYMGKYEVTQEQWEAVMGNNPSYFKGKKNPVENVSRIDIHGFIKKLNEIYTQGLIRLPTEAEWEYACRAGTTTPFNTGNDLTTAQANYGNLLSNQKTTPVGSYPPNAWGLYDMHGNVWEWCLDLYDENYYSKSPEVNPWGPQFGSNERVVRGGAWPMGVGACRSATRVGIDPRSGGRNNTGFRLVRKKSIFNP